MSSYGIFCHILSSFVILCQVMSSFTSYSYPYIWDIARLFDHHISKLLTDIPQRFLEGHSPLKKMWQDCGNMRWVSAFCTINKILTPPLWYDGGELDISSRSRTSNLQKLRVVPIGVVVDTWTCKFCFFDLGTSDPIKRAQTMSKDPHPREQKHGSFILIMTIRR